MRVEQRMSLEEARRIAERRVGYQLTDEEYSGVLAYSKRKLQIIKKDDGYLPLLLENEIRDYCSRQAINLLAEIRKGGHTNGDYSEVLRAAL